MRTFKGWHFLPADRRLGYGDGRLVQVGETIRVEGTPRVGVSGLHACRTALDALARLSGPIACRVVLGGEIDECDGLAAATERTVIAMADASTVLHEFALWCAEQVIHLTDEHESICRRAIKVKRRWLMGLASNEEPDAAADASWSASRAVAKGTQNAELERLLWELLRMPM